MSSKSGGKLVTSDITTEEKRRNAMRETINDLRSFQKKILRAHGGKPLPSSVSDLDEIRDGR